MKIAYFCEPQVGGTFTFFRRLRSGLGPRGVDVRCIPPVSGERFQGTPFADLEGVDYVRWPEGDAAATRVLCRHLVEQGYRAAMILPGCDILTTNLVRYLPLSVRTLARIPMATRGAYRPLWPIRHYLDRVVCLCDQMRSDLVTMSLLESERMALIYNGADVARFTPEGRRPPSAGEMRLLYAGRLEDVQKNVLMLPRLLRELAGRGLPATLRIAGEGPDQARLAQACDGLPIGCAVEFLQSLNQDQLIAQYREADILILPTRFEGSPNVLLEAMACGCVPVVTRLAGSTDIIVRDGQEGFLCRVDDVREFADRVSDLHRDRARLTRMGQAARVRVVDSFTQEQMVENYQRLFHEVQAAPPRPAIPLSVDHYQVPRALRSNWRAYIPTGLKKVVRTVYTRLGKSI